MVEYRKWPIEPPHFELEARPTVVRELSARTLKGVRARTNRGLEISGFFLGNSSASLRQIDSLFPLAPEYDDEPVFRATKPSIEAAIVAAAEQGRIVGFYRSRTDGRLELDWQDDRVLNSAREFAPLVVAVVGQTKSMPAKVRSGVWDGAEVDWTGEFTLKDWHAGAPGIAPAKLKTAAAACVGLAAVILIASRAHERSRPPSGETSRAVFGSAPPIVTPPPITSRPEVVVAPKTVSVQKPPSPVATRARTVAAPPPRFYLPSVKPRRSEPVQLALTLPPPPQLAAQASLPSSQHPTPALRLPATPPAQSLPQPAQPVTFIEPVLERQTTPIVLPPGLRRLLTEEVVVALSLTIDTSGRVIAADRVGSLDKVEESLWGVYARAVSNWRFEPARRNEVPVQAKTVLRFRVAPAP